MQIPAGIEVTSTEQISDQLQRIRVRAGGRRWTIIVKAYEGVSASSAGGRAWISPDGTGMTVDRAIQAAMQSVLAIEAERSRLARNSESLA